MQLTHFVLTILLAVSGLAVIGLVLMQHGKGADAGAGFGGGSNGVFGASGSSNFLSRTTGIFAAVFFVVVIALNLTSSYRPQAKSLLDKINQVGVSNNSNNVSNSGAASTSVNSAASAVSPISGDIPK